jgi:hypothetical protein
MASYASINLNRLQNASDFTLPLLENSPPIFKYELFSKTLDPPKENPERPENYRTVTIKCLYKGCQ